MLAREQPPQVANRSFFGGEPLIRSKPIITAVAVCLSASVASADLELSLNSVVDIGHLDFNGVGGAAFDPQTGNLWLSDSGPSTNNVVELNPANGGVISSFAASIVPGLAQGPDALAMHPGTGNLFLFSAFQEQDVTGQVTQNGLLIPGFDGPENIGGAAFAPDGRLFAAVQSDGTLLELDINSGAIIQTTELVGFSNRVGALDFDPVTGNLVAYSTNTRELLEINPGTGAITGITDISSFLVLPSFPSGIAFDETGSTLFVASGQNAGADELIVLNRVPEPTGLMTMIGLSALAGLRPRRKRLRLS